MWDFAAHSEPVARKEYPCDAAGWIIHSGFGEEDYEPEDWAIIEKAQKEGWKIQKGTKYLKLTGKYDGEFATYRARQDLNEICMKYDLFQE